MTNYFRNSSDDNHPELSSVAAVAGDRAQSMSQQQSSLLVIPPTQTPLKRIITDRRLLLECRSADDWAPVVQRSNSSLPSQDELPTAAAMTALPKIYSPPHGSHTTTPRTTNQYRPFRFEDPHKRLAVDNCTVDSDEISSQQASNKLQQWWAQVRGRLKMARASKATKSIEFNNARSPSRLQTSIPAADPKKQHTLITRLGIFLCSSAAVYVLVFVGMAAGLLYGSLSSVGKIDWSQQLSVAFVGTSYLFVNDVPRLMEAMSDGRIQQDSCLRSGGSLATVLLSGNGMYYRWRTTEARIESNNWDDYYSAANVDDDGSSTSNSTSSSYHPLYDYGACSVQQLLAGKDNYLEYGNANHAYSDDGNNPCLVDQNYFNYITSKYSSLSNTNANTWDYVVLADQSKRMAASADARYDTIDALVSVYAPLLQQAQAVPVIIDTHAFWSTQTNMTGLYDVPTFTRMIHDGVREYASALASELPAEQQPIIVPVGQAYLLIWEESYATWQKLFLSDNMHSSLSGSYLFACVLYTKLFGHLPKRSISLPKHMEYLFAFSRRTIGQDAVYPSQSEAEYLRNIAKRIVLDGVVPKSYNSTGANDDMYSGR